MPERKQHSACDECRRRKLKCSGEMPKCFRCQEEGIDCMYSQQKTMGRPRKRQQGGESNTVAHTPDTNDNQVVYETTFPAYDNWTLPPTDVATRHDDEFQIQYPQAAAAHGSHSTDYMLFNTCEPGAGLQTPEFSNFGCSPNNLSSNGDTTSVIPEFGGFNTGLGVNDTQNCITDSCTCLSGMYLASANMETTRNMGFPNALTALKAGIDSTKAILLCNKCVREAIAGSQNIMLLQSLLHTMARGFDKLLKDIDAEADRAAAASETKMINTGDNSLATMHLHNGAFNCPGRFSMELEPDEWRRITKRLVKKSIFGHSDQLQTLESLVDGTEARQKAWHHAGFAEQAPGGVEEFTGEKDWLCLRMNNRVRQMIAELSVTY